VGIPQPVFRRLQGDILKAIKTPEAVERINQTGFEVIGNTPEQFAAEIKKELALVDKVAKAAHIHLD